MKHFLLTIIMLVAATLTTSASPIGRDKALQLANRFIAGSSAQGIGRHAAPVNHQLNYKDLGYKNLHVFTDEQNGGFVIVANDDCIDPVLAYSHTGRIDPANMPEQLQVLLSGYNDQMNLVTSNTAYVPAVPTSGRKVIKPLIEALWHQYPPLTYRLPYDDARGHSTLVGCVALSLAEIMHYYKYPTGTTQTIPAYTTATQGYEMAALPPTTFDYDKMHLNYWQTYDAPDMTDESLQEVTKLLLYCGCALQMDYSAGGSAAVFDLELISKYFGFDKGACRRYAANYSQDIWEEMVYQELAAGRPVPYSAGAVGNQNHMFIIDGYDGQGYFHGNYGDIGGQDSNSIFCKLGVMDDCLTQTGRVFFSGYNVGQAAIFGFQPDKGGTPVASESHPGYPSTGLNVSKVTYYTPYAGERLKVLVDYSNQGNSHGNLLFLWIDNYLRGGVGTYTDPGQQGQSFIFTGAPNAGTHSVKITSDYEGNNVLYTGSVTITEAPKCTLEVTDRQTEGLDADHNISDILKVTLTVKNTGSTTFCNLLDGFLYAFELDPAGDLFDDYIDDEANGYPTGVWTKPYFLWLEPGQSQVLTFEFGQGVSLKPGFRYIPTVWYYNNGGQYVTIYGANFDDGFFFVGDANGISTIERPATTDGNIYFDLQGRRIDTNTPPRGIYIYQGHKIVIK